VKAIHVARLILRELGRRSAERARDAGVTDAAVEDIWFVVADELDDFLADPARLAAVIAERRAMRARLAERIPPFVFEGEPPPWESWPKRSDVEELARPAAGEIIRGIAGAPGRATGRARVVLHPAEAADLEPGEILVAPITDPSWTPLFVPAVGVVVDVGALLSHAVIVARELGIPAVVSATDATRRLRNGDLITVDGAAGTVTVLEDPARDGVAAG
jgi:pyruvate,water dikinase